MAVKGVAIAFWANLPPSNERWGEGEQNGHQRRAACGWEVGWGAGALGGTGAKNDTKTKISCLIFGVVNTPGGGL